MYFSRRVLGQQTSPLRGPSTCNTRCSVYGPVGRVSNHIEGHEKWCSYKLAGRFVGCVFPGNPIKSRWGELGEPKNETSPFTPHDILEMLSNIEKRDRKEVGGPPSIALFLSHDIDKNDAPQDFIIEVIVIYCKSIDGTYYLCTDSPYMTRHLQTWIGDETKSKKRMAVQVKMTDHVGILNLMELVHYSAPSPSWRQQLLPQHLSSMWASCSSFLGGKFVTPSFTMEWKPGLWLWSRHSFEHELRRHHWVHASMVLNQMKTICARLRLTANDWATSAINRWKSLAKSSQRA